MASAEPQSPRAPGRAINQIVSEWSLDIVNPNLHLASLHGLCLRQMFTSRNQDIKVFLITDSDEIIVLIPSAKPYPPFSFNLLRNLLQ